MPTDDGRILVAGHQPDILAYSGFWYKMAKADIFDVKIWDQYANRGYQRRVKMRDDWATVALVDNNGSHCPIVDKRIDPDVAPAALIKTIEGRYKGATQWKTRGDDVLNMINNIYTDKLWQFNLELILGVRDMLGIDTPISMAKPSTGRGSAGLVSVISRYKNPAYLSGTGARAYMGDCSEFTEAGIPVIWSKHKHITGDSILTVLFDYEEPMEIVMLEDEGA